MGETADVAKHVYTLRINDEVQGISPPSADVVRRAEDLICMFQLMAKELMKSTMLLSKEA